MVTQKFGKRLRELRESKGLSLREFAELSGIDHTQLQRWEAGKRLPPDPKRESGDRMLRQISACLAANGADAYAELSALAILPEDALPRTVAVVKADFTRKERQRQHRR